MTRCVAPGPTIKSLRFTTSCQLIHTLDHNKEGHFTESKFNRIFDRFDHGKKGGLYFSEITDFWAANRCVLDVVGWVFQVGIARMPDPGELALTLYAHP